MRKQRISGRLLFKGGTSLSKIFHAINRFSEDIDLAVDYVALGFTGDRDPRRDDISRTRRANILDEMMAECQRYIGGDFLDAQEAGRRFGGTGSVRRVGWPWHGWNKGLVRGIGHRSLLYQTLPFT